MFNVCCVKNKVFRHKSKTCTVLMNAKMEKNMFTFTFALSIEFQKEGKI